MMTVESFGQASKHWMIGVGGDALDNQLPPGDAERDHLASLQQVRGAASHARRGGSERRMTARIHRMLVQGNRQFDEKVAEFARQAGTFELGRSGVGQLRGSVGCPRRFNQVLSSRLRRVTSGEGLDVVLQDYRLFQPFRSQRAPNLDSQPVHGELQHS